jgi:hypothetical protein
VTFVADVQQVDRKNQTVTLRGAVKTIRLKIKDPEQLKLIKKGDQVEGVFAEAVAFQSCRHPAKPRNRVTKVSPRDGALQDVRD